MVVVCQTCSTRFRIDDARIPAKGRLVRCSQCKATFIAKPAAATAEQAVEEVVAEVTASGGRPVPEATTDLFAAAGAELGESAARPPVSADEERWEFDDAPPKPEAPAAEPRAPEPRRRPAEPEGARSVLDDVGDPAEWDLLRGSVEREAREAQFIEPPPPPKPAPAKTRVAKVAVVKAAPESFLRPLEPEPSAPARAPQSVPAHPLGRLASIALASGAWLALAGFTFVGAGPLWPREAAAPARASARTIGLADGEARDVDGRFLENAFSPSLFVVRGELSRPNPDRRLGLRVHFVAADGARVGEAVWAGDLHSARDLRERSPAALRSALDASAAKAARGGPFVAVFDEVPAEATGFGLSLEPLPEPAPSAEGTAPEATASSPPSPRPSSE